MENEISRGIESPRKPEIRQDARKPATDSSMLSEQEKRSASEPYESGKKSARRAARKDLANLSELVIESIGEERLGGLSDQELKAALTDGFAEEFAAVARARAKEKAALESSCRHVQDVAGIEERVFAAKAARLKGIPAKLDKLIMSRLEELVLPNPPGAVPDGTSTSASIIGTLGEKIGDSTGLYETGSREYAEAIARAVKDAATLRTKIMAEFLDPMPKYSEASKAQRAAMVLVRRLIKIETANSRVKRLIRHEIDSPEKCVRSVEDRPNQ